MEKFIKNPKILIFIILLGILRVGFFSRAELLVDWPDSPGGTSLDKNSDLSTLIKYLYEWGIGLGGLFLFVSLLIAGFQYLTSAGEPVKISEARERIKSAGLGLVLLLGSWLILHTINPDFVAFNTEKLDLDKAFQECDEKNNCPKGQNCKIVSIMGTDMRICVPWDETKNIKKCDKLIIAWSSTAIEPQGTFFNPLTWLFIKLYYAFHDPYSPPPEEQPPAGTDLYAAIEALPYLKMEINAGKPCENIKIGEGKSWIPHNAYIYSEAKTNDEDSAPGDCYGQLLLYKNEDCVDLITSYPVSNWAATIDTEVKSVRLFTGEHYETSGASGGGGGSTAD